MALVLSLKTQMTIFDYDNFCDPKNVGDYPHANLCLYCKTKLKSFEVEDIFGETDTNEILSIQSEVAEVYKEIHGLEDCYLNLYMDSKDEELWVNYCETCGWWRIVKDVCISAEAWQIWDFFYGLSGTLKSLDVSDISVPISEISTYLIAKYESRFSVHPKLFEEVVASVFKNIGHNVYVTGYSNDGGIDIVLQSDLDTLIGIQVKRYKNKIKAEQIRAFAGSLLLAGYNKGIFITTSDFQPGAIKAAQAYTIKTLPVELLDAKRFYDALKISQKTEINIDALKKKIKKIASPLLFSGCVTPRNSL